MHQSFVSTAPLGPGISGAFNFSIFKAPLKALHSGAKIVVKSLLKAPALPGLTIMKNNKRPESFEFTFLAYPIVIPHKLWLLWSPGFREKFEHTYMSHCQNSSKFLSIAYFMKTADVIMFFFSLYDRTNHTC